MRKSLFIQRSHIRPIIRAGFSVVGLATLLSFFTASVMQAQDVHFSQFYYSPFTMNPALTGAMDGTYRFSGIYKNQ